MTDAAMPRTATPSLPLVAVVCTMLAFALVQVVALISTGGAFEYPLDDVYIHLAMAEQIAQGGYGINAGEYASAASSPLYPLLLVPFAGTEAQRLLPLVWNSIGLAVAAALWGRILVQGGYDQMQARWPGLTLAALGPLAVNFPGLGFVGMEHALHLAASLAVLSGLIQTVQTGRVGPLLVAGAVLSPALRLEGLALSLLESAAVVALGHWRRGLALGVASVLPVLIFSGFLLSIGLNALPNSVEAKLIGPGEEDIGRLLRMINVFAYNIETLPGMALLALSMLALAAGPALNRAGNPGARLITYVIGIAGFAHLALAQVGWMNRYEVYILAVLGAGLAWVLPQLPAMGRLRPGLAVLTVAALALSGFHYTRETLFLAPRATLGIHLQQAQMARFAKDFAVRSVAVNDIGRVAWNNPDYVLDLWGLASDTARQMRIYGKDPRWAGSLVRERGVGLAMIYDRWVGDAIGQDWVRLGTLDLRVQVGYIGDYAVAFYATEPALAPELIDALERFVPTLPADVRFRFVGAGG